MKVSNKYIMSKDGYIFIDQTAIAFRSDYQSVLAATIIQCFDYETLSL